jgi:hypothetical protein
MDALIVGANMDADVALILDANMAADVSIETHEILQTIDFEKKKK